MTRIRLITVSALILSLVLALGLAFGWMLGRVFAPTPSLRWLNTATIITQVQGLAELVTVKYVMEKVVVIEDVKVYGENRVLLVAHGVVKAGVDLSKLQPGDLRLSNGKIEVTLPNAAITDVYLDEQKTEVLEHSTGLLRRFDKDLQQTARREGVDAIRRSARYSGILEDAQTRAEQQLTQLFRHLGFEQVEFHR
jgi:hypothetical protein